MESRVDVEGEVEGSFEHFKAVFRRFGGGQDDGMGYQKVDL